MRLERPLPADTHAMRPDPTTTLLRNSKRVAAMLVRAWLQQSPTPRLFSAGVDLRGVDERPFSRPVSRRRHCGLARRGSTGLTEDRRHLAPHRSAMGVKLPHLSAVRSAFDSLGGVSNVSLLALMLAAGLGTFCLRAKDFGKEAVRVASETWVRHVTADARPDATVERMEGYQMGATTVAYIVHLAGGGFCLTGADSLVLPVYLYCPTGTYDPQGPGCRFSSGRLGPGSPCNGVR
jgi:hypothetical protein